MQITCQICDIQQNKLLFKGTQIDSFLLDRDFFFFFFLGTYGDLGIGFPFSISIKQYRMQTLGHII